MVRAQDTARTKDTSKTKDTARTNDTISTNPVTTGHGKEQKDAQAPRDGYPVPQCQTCAAWLRPETTGATGEPERETSTSPALAVRDTVRLRVRDVSNLGVIMGVEQDLVACKQESTTGWFL